MSYSQVSLLRSTAQWCWVTTWKFSCRELSVTKPDLSCTQITCHGPVRCEASRLGSEPRAGPGFHDKICNLSVGRRLGRSDLKAGRGDLRGKRSRNSAAGSQSLYRWEMRVARLLEEHGWRVCHASRQSLSSSRKVEKWHFITKMKDAKVRKSCWLQEQVRKDRHNFRNDARSPCFQKNVVFKNTFAWRYTEDFPIKNAKEYMISISVALAKHLTVLWENPCSIWKCETTFFFL